MQILFDLAERPELVEELREEISIVERDAKGGIQNNQPVVLSPTFLSKLYKMDSLFKESQRFHHANLCMNGSKSAFEEGANI